MKQIMICLAACSMLLTTGCSSEEALQQENNQEYTLELNVGTESRTLFDGDGNCIWGQNEKIYVTSQDGKVTGTLSLIATENGGKKAKFKGYVSGNPSNLKYAVYPVPTNNVISQTALDGTNHNAPMTAAIGAGDDKTFDYAGGLVRLEVTGANTADVTGDAVGLKYEFNLSTGKLEAIPGSGQKVSVSFNNDGYAYIPVNATETVGQTTLEVKPAGVTNPIQIEATIKKSAVSKEEIAPIVVNGTTAETVKVVSTVANLTTAVKEGGYIRLAEKMELETALVIDENVTVEIDLSGKTIQLTGMVEGGGAVFEISDGTLNITGDGEVIASTEENATGNNAVWAKGDGIVNIYGGTFKNYGVCAKDENNPEDQEDLIYVNNSLDGNKSYEGKAQVNIYGGTFMSEVAASERNGIHWLLNQKNGMSEQRIFVYSGVFHYFNPEVAHTNDEWMGEGGTGSYLAVGAACSESNGVYTVTSPN